MEIIIKNSEECTDSTHNNCEKPLADRVLDNVCSALKCSSITTKRLEEPKRARKNQVVVGRPATNYHDSESEENLTRDNVKFYRY